MKRHKSDRPANREFGALEFGEVGAPCECAPHRWLQCLCSLIRGFLYLLRKVYVSLRIGVGIINCVLRAYEILINRLYRPKYEARPFCVKSAACNPI